MSQVPEIRMQDSASLIVFGPIDRLGADNIFHHISGMELFRGLTSRGVWFCSRRVTIQAGTPVLFYLKHTGVVGSALIQSASTVEECDNSILSRYGLIGYFRTKLGITDTTRIDPAVDLKPLIQRLGFIANKGNHWGTSLRSTPRRIPKTDFNLIIARAKSHDKRRRAE
jgi:hypothetical protein